MTCFCLCQKLKPRPEEQTPCHSSFSFAVNSGIICGQHRWSFAVLDHLRSNLVIISGLGIICCRGSFAALYRSATLNSRFRKALWYMVLPSETTLWGKLNGEFWQYFQNRSLEWYERPFDLWCHSENQHTAALIWLSFVGIHVSLL